MLKQESHDGTASLTWGSSISVGQSWHCSTLCLTKSCLGL